MENNKMAMNDEQMDKVTGGTILRHQVKPGETLISIAKQYNVSVEQLLKWNNIQNPSLVMPGTVLMLKF